MSISDLRSYVEDRCIPEPNTGCWIWLLSLGSHGYGNATAPWAKNKHRVEVAHRVSYTAFKGPIPTGMLIQHSCDNKWCVNPDHLSVGTALTNCLDKIRKGRGNYENRRNPPCCSRKFTAGEVASLRASTDSNVELAHRLGVARGLVAKIRAGHGYGEAADAQLAPLNFVNDPLPRRHPDKCRSGHELSLVVRKDRGGITERYCKVCRADWQRRTRVRKRAARGVRS